MKLEQFEQVLEIAKTGTFSQAARNLYMSQPNLSLSVKQLEGELGCQIFVRTSEGVIPTEKGRELIEYMSAIQSQYDLLRKNSRNPDSQKEMFNIVTVNLHRCIPHFVNLVKKYQDAPISFSFLNCDTVDEAIQMVETSQADIAVFGIMKHHKKKVMVELDQRNIEYTPISSNDVQAVIGPTNDYYARDALTTADLSTQTVLTFGNLMTNPFGAIWDFHHSGISSRGRIYVDNNYLFYELVQTTSVVGLISGEPGKESLYYQKHWPDIRRLSFTDYSMSGEVGWIRLRRMPLSEVAQEFLRSLSDSTDPIR